VVLSNDGPDDGGAATVQTAFIQLNFGFVQLEDFGTLEIVAKDVRGVEKFDLLGPAGGVL